MDGSTPRERSGIRTALVRVRSKPKGELTIRLRHSAAVRAEAMRGSDDLVGMGGGEFALVMPGACPTRR